MTATPKQTATYVIIHMLSTANDLTERTSYIYILYTSESVSSTKRTAVVSGDENRPFD